jgi:hypothetical protein
MKYELQNVISGKGDLSMELLSKQLKEAREQVNWLKSQSSSESKKQKS